LNIRNHPLISFSFSFTQDRRHDISIIPQM
jgi:hypothetical protein